jgi:hypothetical protein
MRANGSRERAPDDRLREAIQSYRNKAGLLRRSAPRNDEVGVYAFFGRIASGVSGWASGCAVANSGIAIDVS